MDTDLSQLVNQGRAAQILGLSPRTMESWRLTGGGPVYITRSAGECDTARATLKPGSTRAAEHRHPIPDAGRECRYGTPTRAVALWCIHAHSLDATSVTPILAIPSPAMRCGKTTTLSLLNRLVPRPLLSSNISPAAVFRIVEKYSPTLLIDEADTFVRMKEEFRGILNSGHTRDAAYVVRTVGDEREPCRFSTWTAKAVAMIVHI